jgi:hypothetical protein
MEKSREKLQQAMDVTPLGAYHRTADAIVSAIPEAVVGELSVTDPAINNETIHWWNPSFTVWREATGVSYRSRH